MNFNLSQRVLQMRAMAGLIVLLIHILFNLSDVALAQPPQVIATGGNQQIVHDFTGNPQRFDLQTWNVVVPNSYRGATVVWSAGPFQHLDDSQFKADTQLEISIRRSQGEARWAAVLQSSRTNLSRNSHQAAVSAASERTGHAQIDLQVSFIEVPNQVLAAGHYEVTVTATITEN